MQSSPGKCVLGVCVQYSCIRVLIRRVDRNHVHIEGVCIYKYVCAGMFVNFGESWLFGTGLLKDSVALTISINSSFRVRGFKFTVILFFYDFYGVVS